ncbi:MAG: hypothetical protein WC976_05885 [Caldisericia bacterium]
MKTEKRHHRHRNAVVTITRISALCLFISTVIFLACSRAKYSGNVEEKTQALMRESLLAGMLGDLQDTKELYAQKKYEQAYNLAKQSYSEYAPYRKILPKADYDELEVYLNITAWAYERSVLKQR